MDDRPAEAAGLGRGTMDEKKRAEGIEHGAKSKDRWKTVPLKQRDFDDGRWKRKKRAWGIELRAQRP
jgi:hypothetical protein